MAQRRAPRDRTSPFYRSDDGVVHGHDRRSENLHRAMESGIRHEAAPDVEDLRVRVRREQSVPGWAVRRVRGSEKIRIPNSVRVQSGAAFLEQFGGSARCRPDTSDGFSEWIPICNYA